MPRSVTSSTDGMFSVSTVHDAVAEPVMEQTEQIPVLPPVYNPAPNAADAENVPQPRKNARELDAQCARHPAMCHNTVLNCCILYCCIIVMLCLN